MNPTERALLNNYQRNFPLTPRPYLAIARELGCDESMVVTLLKRFIRTGVISRIGPVFRPNTVGVSTLAAMTVPAARLQQVADAVSACPAVNHNYEREHRFNLWFVVNAPTRSDRNAVLAGIEAETGLSVMSLPLERDYHIDLGFDIDFDGAAVPRMDRPAAAPAGAAAALRSGGQLPTDLVAAIQGGLAVVGAPFARIASETGLSEGDVINLIGARVRTGVIKRFGIVVRHRELGYRANAMCVWDLPEERIDELGKRIATIPYVTLCYRRRRCLPDWPYNLFCMIHGKDRATVLGQVRELAARFELGGVPGEVLFSGRCFKQRGAYYRQPHTPLTRRRAQAVYG